MSVKLHPFLRTVVHPSVRKITDLFDSPDGPDGQFSVKTVDLVVTPRILRKAPFLQRTKPPGPVPILRNSLTTMESVKSVMEKIRMVFSFLMERASAFHHLTPHDDLSHHSGDGSRQPLHRRNPFRRSHQEPAAFLSGKPPPRSPGLDFFFFSAPFSRLFFQLRSFRLFFGRRVSVCSPRTLFRDHLGLLFDQYLGILRLVLSSFHEPSTGRRFRSSRSARRILCADTLPAYSFFPGPRWYPGSPDAGYRVRKTDLRRMKQIGLDR